MGFFQFEIKRCIHNKDIMDITRDGGGGQG